MSKATFSKTIAQIQRINNWYDAFPHEAELSRLRVSSLRAKKPPVDYTIVNALDRNRDDINAALHAQGRKRQVPSLDRLREWAETSTDESFNEKLSRYRWPGVLDIVKRLQQPQLYVSKFFRQTERLRRDILRIRKNLRYSNYSKKGMAQAAYKNAVCRYIASVKRAKPTSDLRVLKHTLIYAGSHRRDVCEHQDQESLLRYVIKLLRWVKETRREGRPADDGSILLYHLVNSLTLWQRKKNGEPRKDKKGRVKVERRWDDIARVLIWLHYKKLRVSWLAVFIKHHASKDATSAMTDLKKLMQSRYSHLSKHAKPGQTYEAAFCPLGLVRVFSLKDHLSRVEL